MGTNPIPIRNLYFLLAYAWEWLPESEEGELGIDSCPDAINLLTLLLCQQTKRLVRRGLEKKYLSQLECGVRISGRIALTETLELLARKSHQICFERDELSRDILPNQILKSTLCQLRRSEQLAPGLRNDVWHALASLQDVDEIGLTTRSFSRLIYHRNNRHYRLALEICELLHDLCLPDSSPQGEHSIRFLEILDDEKEMARIFEKFVLNFACMHFPETNPRSQKLRWQGNWTKEYGDYLPRMQTDITLGFPNRVVILDCKYYREALKQGLGMPKLRSGHLYQLLAYLQNSAAEMGRGALEGMLLYPTNGVDLDLDYELLGFPVRIRTLDLSSEWQAIEESLRSILLGKS
jgi:5-methylcytosine-specific restriction enzyme subunit McrC